MSVSIANIGDKAAGEVEGVAELIDDEFDDVGVVGVFVVCEGAGEGGHGGVGVVGEALDELVDCLGFYFGFIALDVDDEA